MNENYAYYHNYHHSWLTPENYLTREEVSSLSSTPVVNPLKIELSVVQSPKVFGMETLNQLASSNIEKDERMIERHVADSLVSPSISKPNGTPQPRRPLSAPLDGVRKPVSIDLFTKKEKAKLAELASPIKITTSNWMLGLNPLFSMPPISPLKSPNQITTTKAVTETNGHKDAVTTSIAQNGSDILVRKRAGSFASEIMSHQPPKKRFSYGSDAEALRNGASDARSLLLAEHRPYPKSLAASLFADGANQRSLSVETVAAYDQLHSKPPKDQTFASAMVDDNNSPTIPKSYAPEFDLASSMGGSNPGAMLTRSYPTPRGVAMMSLEHYPPHMRSPAYGSPYSSVLGPPMGAYGHRAMHRPLAPPRVSNPAAMPYPRAPPVRVTASSLRPAAHPTSTASKNGAGPTLQHNIIQEIRNLPQGECFQVAMATWQWYSIDGVDLPCVLRNGECYVAVHMVQMKLLAKFPPNVPQELMRKHRMVSYKMSVLESWVLNTVNAVHCKFEYGYQLFSPADDLVRGADVRKFYFSVKIYNYDRIVDVYRHEINAIAELHVSLTAHVSSLRACAEEELGHLSAQEAREEHRTPTPYLPPRSKEAMESPHAYRLPVAPAPQGPTPVSGGPKSASLHHHLYMNGQAEVGRAPGKLERMIPPAPHYSGLQHHERQAMMAAHHPAAMYQNSLRTAAVHGQRPTMMRTPYSLPIHSPLNMMSAPVTPHHDQAPPMHRMLPPTTMSGYAAHHLMQHPANGHHPF